MDQSGCGIEGQYIVPQSYAAVAQQSKRRNILYDNYLQILQKIFSAYRQFYDETHQLVKVKVHQKSIYLEQFKNFLRKYGQVIKDTSVYQVDCLTDLRANRQDIVSKPASQIIAKVQSFIKPQKVFKSKIDQLSNIKQQVSKQYLNLKSQSSEASAFYNSRNMKTKAKTIKQNLDDISKIEKDLESGRQEINNNAYQFEGYLINFRKKLLQNKYNMLTKMNDQSKHFRNCLTQILLLLVGCVNSKMEYFTGLVKNPKDDTITISQTKGRKRNQDIDTQVSHLINSIQQYNLLIDEIIVILKGFDVALKRMNTKIQDILENNKKYFLDNLNNIYSSDETPSRQVIETLDLYEHYTSKMAGISDKLYICSNKLNMLKQNVKKHADVTLSLIRSSNNKNQGKNPQLQQVYNQISYDFVTDVLCQVYRSFKQVLSDLKTHFNQKYYKKKKMKVQDSMEVSHIDETMMVVQKKKPCKKQLWLWRDWRDKSNYSVQSSKNEEKQISQFISTIKNQEQSKEIGKYQCVFHGKKEIKGFLKVCEKALEFISLIGTSNVHLSIPYHQISSVESKVRIIQKYIAVQTEKGEIGFSKLANMPVVIDQIKQQLQKANQSGGTVKVVKKAAVALLPQQIDYLQKNKARIQQARPKTDGMMKIKSIFVDNITMDLVYEYIYSDKPFTLRGKPQDSFFAYAMKKSKNFNYVAGQYDKPGPDYYSRNPDVKFTNCPLISVKTNQFDHPIPPIPFMPKFCHCKQKTSMFWISHQALDYYIVSQSSGAPYADTFVVKILHRINKQGNGVKIQVFGGLFFVKQTGMKGMLKSKGQAEMIQGGEYTVNQIQKTLNIVAGNSSANDQPKQQAAANNAGQKVGQTSGGNQVNKLKSQNKLLIIALVVVFLVNVLLRLIM